MHLTCKKYISYKRVILIKLIIFIIYTIIIKIPYGIITYIFAFMKEKKSLMLFFYLLYSFLISFLFLISYFEIRYNMHFIKTNK